MSDKGQSQFRPLEHAACTACGFANPAGFRFCGGCGAALETGALRSVTAPIAPLRPELERRHLTVLFCDLVGSTVLSTRLDPEELRDVIGSFQAACTAVIQRFDGTITRYMGDGILALFGYPRAHEDNAERAVRAGLDLVEAMAQLPLPPGADAGDGLQARVGIASGIVVAGDLIGEGAAQEEAVVGETPNLAARLQALASANSVVIAADTRALIGERFECVDLGVYALHGFADAVRAWRVIAPRFAGSRFEAAQPANISPLINQEEPMHWLRQMWAAAEQGRGRAVLLAGEAGIGKSRLIEALREHLAGAPHAAVYFQCSPHYVNTALHPVIEHVERAAGIGREDIPLVRLAKLAQWSGTGSEAGAAVALLGSLLSISGEDQFQLPAMSAQRQQERTFDLLLGLMQRQAAERPLLVVFEDLHWVDPTTQEFLALLIERVREMRVLLILTFRPDFKPPWRGQPHVEYRDLKKLAPEHSTELAEQVSGGRRLPASVLAQVVAKTDGVPLFIEELTRVVIGTGLLSEHEDRYTLRESMPQLSIPSTLQDSLMARLDQLGPAKLVAQVAGAIGREFSYELLEAVIALPPERLRNGLQVLERAGLVHAERRSAWASHAFKHALVQEAAYQSLLHSRRRELHARIATVLESRFPQTVRDVPELLAHHWSEASNAERAVECWLAAGQHAGARSQYREAIGHLRLGLEWVSRLADPQVQRERELALRLALAPALIISQGGGTPEVGASYARALELCEGTPASAMHFAAHWGWWRASMDHRMGRQRADKVLALAQNLGTPTLLVQAHHCQWATLYMLGAHSECCRHIEVGLALYEPARDRVDAALYSGHDARVCALGEGGLARWMLGYPQRARDLVHSALSWAEELAHVGSRAHAMDFALVLQRFRRDAGAVYLRAGDLIDFAAEQKLRVFHARGAFFRGWARAMHDDPAAGLAEMLKGIAAAQAADTPHDFPLYYEMLAEIYARAGRFEEGLRSVDDAFHVAERHGIVFWNAELHRRRGELMLASGDRDAAAACFQEALACARAQEARALELRAAVSLARLHLEQGNSETTRVILRPVYAGFSEGFDTPDLTEARELLEAPQ